MCKPFALLVLGAIALFSGCKATPPGKYETSLLTAIKHSITIGGKKDINPLADTPQQVDEGREAFSYYCAACHGLDGQNTGVPFADRLSPPVPPLTDPKVQAYTDGQLHWILVNGIMPSGMPASRGILTDHELWSIVVFIRHLPAAGSLGEPAMYSGDQDGSPCPTPTAQAR